MDLVPETLQTRRWFQSLGKIWHADDVCEPKGRLRAGKKIRLDHADNFSKNNCFKNLHPCRGSKNQTKFSLRRASKNLLKNVLEE